jgi:hypothetical protein
MTIPIMTISSPPGTGDPRAGVGKPGATLPPMHCARDRMSASMPERVTRAAALACVLALTAVLVGCGGGNRSAQQSTASAPAQAPAAVVPPGWKTHETSGLSVAYPPEWQPRTEREARPPTFKFGVPFTGQPAPPPFLAGFVETEPVGNLSVREPVLRKFLESGLPNAVFEPSRRVQVAGASEAVEFFYTYTTSGGESVLGTKLEPTQIRQVDLLIERPGLPKYGLRYGAPVSQFEEELWRQIVASLSVRPGS